MAEKPHEEEVAMAPDPDEDDLDDLDDVLDQFSAKPTPAATTSSSSVQPPVPPSNTTTAAAPTASGPGRPPTGSSKDATAPPSSEEDFASQLQAGMSSLISELDGNPDMQAQFEQMMQELIAAGAAENDAEAGKHLARAAEAEKGVEAVEKAQHAQAGQGGKKAGGSGTGEEKFGETIRRTMERMQHSDSTASASATTSSGGANMSEEDMLAQMMRELQAGGGAGGMEGEEDFNKLLLNMMSQLTNKEILYEPMKELHTKFPAWMEKNEGKVEKAEMERYQEQQRLVGEIVGRFERRGYSDEDEGDREFIVERMQKMQAAGSPPADLVGDMSAAQEALGDLDAGCPTQ